MYNLDINFLKDRQEEQPLVNSKTTQVGATGSQSNLPLILGGVIMLLLPAVVFGYSLQLAEQNEKILAENRELDNQIAQAKGETQAIAQKRQQLAQVKRENIALVSVFTKITPWSAVYQDISDRIPTGVQIRSIQEQSPSGNGSTRDPVNLEIKGYATTQGAVNDFLLTLQESKFLATNKTQIEDTRLVKNAIAVETAQFDLNLEDLGIKQPELVEYSIKTQLNNTPASELTEELSRKGAVGIVRRIRTLEEKGIPVK